MIRFSIKSAIEWLLKRNDPKNTDFCFCPDFKKKIVQIKWKCGGFKMSNRYKYIWKSMEN